MMKTPETINGKTPEEIKKAILCAVPCNECAYEADSEKHEGCSWAVTDDTLALIHYLESRLAQAERERDALIRNHIPQTCDTCKYGNCFSFDNPCNTCNHLYRFNAVERGDTDRWELADAWAENTKEEEKE